jgi:ParB family chromosome partitioning protein
LARQIGKSQSAVANKLRILKLSDRIKKILLENGLSERHARSLLRLGNEDEQLTVLNRIISDELTVKKTDDLVSEMINETANQKDRKGRESRIKVKSHIKDLRLFTNTIKQAVDIMNGSGINTVCEIDQKESGCDIRITVTYSSFLGKST